MSDKATYILEIAALTLLGVFCLLLLTIWVLYRLHAKKIPSDAKPILDAIEGVRQQQSAEHSAMQGEQRTHTGMLRQMLDRFGFLRRIK